MSTVASNGSDSAIGTVLRKVRSVSISVPASRRARAAALTDARRIYGFDLTDEERANKRRNRRVR